MTNTHFSISYTTITPRATAATIAIAVAITTAAATTGSTAVYEIACTWMLINSFTHDLNTNACLEL
jgi:hypothetical protein